MKRNPVSNDTGNEYAALRAEKARLQNSRVGLRKYANLWESPTLESPTLESPTLESPTLESPTLESPTLESIVSRTFKLTIAYDGTGFAGWQVQPGKPTVQGLLQDALREMTGTPVQVIGSGRTDAGVHAIAQVASCTLPWRDEAERLALALNTRLPESIVVRQAVEVPHGFHAIRDAIGKRYRYQLQVGGQRDPFSFRYRWRLRGEIDLDPMRSAAARLVGRHDFASFQAAGSDRKTTIRDVRACEVMVQREEGVVRFDHSLHVAVEVEADGFLYNMVRNIVGSLVEVGRGKYPPQWMDEVLSRRDRDAAGPTAPAHGLFLLRVDYP